MNFKKYFLLAEEIKKPDIIDLYIMMAMPTPEDAKYKAIYDDVFRRVVYEVKLEIQNIVLRELRHASTTTHDDMYNDKKLKALFPNQDVDPYAVRVSLDWLRKNWSSMREMTIDDFAEKTGVPWTIDSIINAFKRLDWHMMYGGNNWAKIAEQAKNLLEAGPGDTIKALDRFVDYVHNTGAVANKFKGYKEGWLNFILDLKAQSRNIRELIPYASYEVRQLFRDPAWRNYMMTTLPGLGAADSDQVIVDMFKKYAPDIINTIGKMDMWLSDPDFISDFAETPKTAKKVMSHISLMKLFDEYGLDRVADALKTDPSVKKLLNKFINTVGAEEGHGGWKNDLTPEQEKILKALGWIDPATKIEDDEDQDYFDFAKKPGSAKKKPGWGSKVPKGKAAPAKGKLAKKKPPQKKTYWDDRRGEWVQTKV